MSPVITQVVFDLIHQEQTDEAIEATKAIFVILIAAR